MATGKITKRTRDALLANAAAAFMPGWAARPAPMPERRSG